MGNSNEKLKDTTPNVPRTQSGSARVNTTTFRSSSATVVNRPSSSSSTTVNRQTGSSTNFVNQPTSSYRVVYPELNRPTSYPTTPARTTVVTQNPGPSISGAAATKVNKYPSNDFGKLNAADVAPTSPKRIPEKSTGQEPINYNLLKTEPKEKDVQKRLEPNKTYQIKTTSNTNTVNSRYITPVKSHLVDQEHSTGTLLSKTTYTNSYIKNQNMEAGNQNLTTSNDTNNQNVHSFKSNENDNVVTRAFDDLSIKHILDQLKLNDGVENVHMQENRNKRDINRNQNRGRFRSSSINSNTDNTGETLEQSNKGNEDRGFHNNNRRGRGRSVDRRGRGGRGRNPQNNGNFQGNQNYHYNQNNEISGNSNNTGAKPKQNFSRNRPPRRVGFKKMEFLLEKEPNDIMLDLQNCKNEFEEFLGSDDISPDCLVLSLHVFTKMSHGSFLENLTQVLKVITASRYMEKLMLFIYNLSDQTNEEKRRNKFFWNSVDDFWINLSIFCINILDKMPATGQDVIPKILKAVIQTIPNFESRYQIMIQDEVKNNLENIQLRLAKLSERKIKATTKSVDKEDEEIPPDDFRDIQIYPLPHELLDGKEVFLRKNKIEGKYKDVDHYLDVQFRLLREDFVSPLRKGIQEYLYENNKKRFSNISIYKNVECIRMEKTQSQIGYLMQVFKKGKMRNIERSKRFMFGGLVCFTPDNFKTITFGKILDRKIEYLREGQILVGFENEIQFNPDIVYTMIECKIYFEPYYQVLKALQNMQTINFPLKRYLVDVEHEREFPGYVDDQTVFNINDYHVHLSGDWFNISLGLNESQTVAFQNALCSKFCIIQGPPGTGKTYLGLKIAKTLISNRKKWNDNHPMLVICYTNHALDQFLEGLLETTKKIVRVGGQSRSDKLNDYNIRKLRSLYSRNTLVNSQVYYDRRDEMKAASTNLQRWNDTYSKMINCDAVFTPHTFLSIDANLKDDNWILIIEADKFLSWLLQIPASYQQNQPVAFENPEENEIENDDNPGELNDNENNVIKLHEDLDDDFVSTFQPCLVLKNMVKSITELEASGDVYDPRAENFYIHRQMKQTHEYLKYQLDTLRDLLKRNVDIPALTNADYKNIKKLRCEQRWQLYGSWIQKMMRASVQKITANDKQFRVAYQKYTEVCDIVDTKIMEQNVVIGMTTTGAARLQSSLQTLKCPIVIVEEAAEVLESHVITSLTENCQHLILIGDHKQLKPSTSDFRLDKDFHLGVSLFERMVRNNVHCDTLNVQHRMRPEIARLVCPNIYTDLKNHESVNLYPAVKGVDKSLFFITHENSEEEATDNSKENHHEARYLILLARYLVLNGYEPEDITILVAYSGQFFVCNGEKRKYDILKDVKICVLDNYQGEENKIILLSLVRNNKDNKVGFLYLENRVCVALSRAKEGMFVMGNINLLAETAAVWKPIKMELENTNAVGRALPLRCRNHNNLTLIEEIEDFQKVSEGGCSHPCNTLLDCDHFCQKICHITPHDVLKCFQDCQRIICERNHQCPKRCYQECGDCVYPVETLLLCGHTNFIPCYQKLEDVKCTTMVETTLPCGHKAQKPCYMPPEKFQCPHWCESRIEPCGHSCLKRCHYFDDRDHTEYLCKKSCERANKNCSRPKSEDHKCRKACYEKCNACHITVRKHRTSCPHMFDVLCSEDVEQLICVKPCKKKLACGHDCKLKCSEPCSTYKCKIMVDKQIKDCGHTVKFMCHSDPPKSACTAKCERILPCGHKCRLKCKETCSQKTCKELVKSNISSPCGHVLDVPCYLRNETVVSEELLSYCKAKCNKLLNCEHYCSGTCGECSQGRIHKDCKEGCKNIFICGHECTIACRAACLPCQKPCTYRCIHSKCSKKCGMPCTKCIEPCARKCKHGSCEAKCFEKCTIQPCMEPCNKLLTCGHPCIGFCGDPCPPLCRICNEEEVTEIFFGTEDEEDARFVYLPDCKHVVESEGLEQFFSQNNGDKDKEIGTISCPKCKTQVTYLQRFSDLLKESFKDVQKTKTIIYGEKSECYQIHRRLLRMGDELKEQHQAFLKRHAPIAMTWLNAFNEKLLSAYKNRRLSLSKQELQGLESRLQIFTNIMKNTEKFSDLSPSGLSLLLKQIIYLVKSLNDCESLSTQKIDDFEKELNRLKRIKELAALAKNAEYLQEYGECCKVAFSFKPYNNSDDNILINLLIDLNEKSKSGLRISERERLDIIKAMGFSSGHWFKCRNGHIYAIGECGGAMQQSICPECKTVIGGESHRLDPSNSYATEMDGARMGAFDQAARLFNQGRFF